MFRFELGTGLHHLNALFLLKFLSMVEAFMLAKPIIRGYIAALIGLTLIFEV